MSRRAGFESELFHEPTRFTLLSDSRVIPHKSPRGAFHTPNSRDYTYSIRVVGSCTLQSHELHAEAPQIPAGRAPDVSHPKVGIERQWGGVL